MRVVAGSGDGFEGVGFAVDGEIYGVLRGRSLWLFRYFYWFGRS